MKNIFEKVLALHNITRDEALTLWREAPLAELMAVAHAIRLRLHPQNVVSWQIDRNVNTTNVCVSGCRFCNFHCKLHQTDRAYITSIEQYRQKIDETLAAGGDQLLLQGGMHPRLGIEYYETLFRQLKSEYPTLRLHALGPPEVFHLARMARISTIETLRRLIAAGLDSLPGAGAEILDNDVRKRISPGKCSADEWLEVMREAQALGLLTSATMMYGHVETLEQRIEHLFRIRETGGFLAFIPWAYQGQGTELAKQEGVVGGNNTAEYLRLVALSRIVMLNIPNIQASWLTMGIPAAQMALHGGANDMGSIMIEENVVSAAGSHNTLNVQSMQHVIHQAGFTPMLRDQAYNPRKLSQ